MYVDIEKAFVLMTGWIHTRGRFVGPFRHLISSRYGEQYCVAVWGSKIPAILVEVGIKAGGA